MKTRYIPANSETREFPAAALVAYCYASGVRHCFMAYKGRQSRAAYAFGFATAKARDRYLAGVVERETEREDAKRARKEVGHGLAVGDVVYTEWGYEQTNVNYYQVLRVPSPRSAVVRELEADRIEDGPMSMTGRAVPRLGDFRACSKEMTRRAAGLHTINIGDSQGAGRKWSGEPRRVSWYA